MGTKMRHDRITREDVAQRAGVSVATVSMSLYNDTRITESTKRLVRTVAREMNYRPVASARALAGGRGCLGSPGKRPEPC